MTASARMRTRTTWFLIVALAGWVCVSVQAPLTVGAASLLWQTTFNCPKDWTQSMGLADALVCAAGDGISGSGAWTSTGHPLGDEITLAANNPGGGGGRGFRHWR